jgi:anti-sigma-K factor RskA
MEPAEHSEQLEELLAEYVLGNLTPEEIAQVQELLEHHPDLQIELNRLQSTLAMMPLALPATAPSPQLEARILQAAEAEGAATIHAGAKSKGLAKLPIWQWGGAIAAVIIASLGVATYKLHHQLAATQLENERLNQQLSTVQATLEQIRNHELATTRQQLSRYQEAVNLLRQPNNRFLTLKGTSPKLKSSGSLVMVPTKGSAMLVLRNVDPVSAGKVYRLWAIVDGQKVACGDFKPNDQGDVFWEVPLNQWGGSTEVVVTIEPDQALPMPVGDMVISGS